jgi:hypothetical protein
LRFLDRLPKVCAFIPNSEVAGGFIGILTTDGTDFHGFKNTTNRFENVSITLSSSVPFRAIRGLISVFGFIWKFETRFPHIGLGLECPAMIQYERTFGKRSNICVHPRLSVVRFPL